MLAIALASGVFLAVCGVIFLIAPFLPARLPGAAFLHRTMELGGRFEAGASLAAGAMFLLAGAGVLVNLDGGAAG